MKNGLFMTGMMTLLLLEGCASGPESMRYATYDDYEWDDDKSYALNVVNHALPDLEARDANSLDDWVGQKKSFMESDGYKVANTIINTAAFGLGGLASSSYLAVWDSKDGIDKAANSFSIHYVEVPSGEPNVAQIEDTVRQELLMAATKTFGSAVQLTYSEQQRSEALQIPVSESNFCSSLAGASEKFHDDRCRLLVGGYQLRIRRIGMALPEVGLDPNKRYATVTVAHSWPKLALAMWEHVDPSTVLLVKKKTLRFASTVPFVLKDSTFHGFVRPGTESNDQSLKPEAINLYSDSQYGRFYTSASLQDTAITTF
ncbi:hypothetical protein [Ferrimonas kyonanensis]|uniref:hypothetical protein n=1 Tax=Ferrimonas kyonanensis TaxID=364763 RepID=UPI00040049D5|nr:hypothetical protein [Ferrimonas kyonanensis]